MLLVSVPTSAYDTFAEPFADVRTKLVGAATMTGFSIPELRVGTLDSLMILDEELAKVDVLAEQSIIKIQRQFNELTADVAGQGGDNKLLVKGTTPIEYLEAFAWDEARYSHSRRLNELVKMIQQSVGKIDDDMKTLGQDFNETKQQLAGLQRKRAANLMVADLRDVLTKDACLQQTGQTPDEIFKETTFLQPAAVIVPVSQEEEFRTTYERLSDGIVSLKDGTKFSPVVPGSLFEIMRDTDGYILYRVFLLKGTMPEGSQAGADGGGGGGDGEAGGDGGGGGGGGGGGEKEGAKDGATAPPAAAAARNYAQESRPKDFFTHFADSCRSHRFLVKKYEPHVVERDSGEEADADNSLDAQIAHIKAERDRQMQYLKRRCTPYFEDVYVAWIHIKAIRVFVESVLRYGVPPQFHSVLVVPKAAVQMRKIRQVLEKSFGGLDTMNASKLAVSEDVQRVLGGTSSAEYLPYVNVAINFLE